MSSSKTSAIYTFLPFHAHQFIDMQKPQVRRQSIVSRMSSHTRVSDYNSVEQMPQIKYNYNLRHINY